MPEYTRYQHEVIKQYYRSRQRLAEQRLGELVSELYLAKGKKLNQLWKNTAAALKQVGLPQSRIDHIQKSRDPGLVAGVVKELQSKKQ